MLKLHLDLVLKPLDNMQAFFTIQGHSELRCHFLESHTLLEVLPVEGEERVQAVDLDQLF